VFKAWVGTLFDFAPVLRDIAPVLRDFALVLRQVSAPQTCQTMRIMVATTILSDIATLFSTPQSLSQLRVLKWFKHDSHEDLGTRMCA
jgi:hypothetical protein